MASSKRERELARLRAQRQAARRQAAAEEARKRRNAIFMGLSALAVAGVIVLIAVLTSGGSKKTNALTTPSATPTASPTPSLAPGTCGYSGAGIPSKAVVGLPPTLPKYKRDVHVKMKTNRGEIDLTLHGKNAPCTVGSFVFLAAQQYFDNTKCHRLTTAGIFVLQCGDPSATGSGGPGYQYADENLTALGAPDASGSVTYPRGSIAMANAGPGTNGSQFFLVYKNSPLQPNYTLFGTITKGLAILDAVAKGGATPVGDGKPKLPVTLISVTFS